MLPSLSAPEPYLWTCVPAPGVDQVARVLYYFFCFPDRIEGPKTPFAFWRYRVNEILAEDDLQPEDSKDVALRENGYPFPQPCALSKDNSGGSVIRQPGRSMRSR